MKLPVGWRKIKLKDCGKWLGGATPSKDKASFWNGDIPWASSQDIKSRTLKSTTYSITVEGLNNSSSNLIPVNSLLMVTRSGILRHTFPVSKTLFPVAINQDIKALIPHIEFSTDYIQALLSVDNVNILKLCSKVGTTVESIEYDALRSYLLLFPPLSEQQRIAEFLGTWDEAIEKLERLVEAKEKLHNHLINELFFSATGIMVAISDFAQEISWKSTDFLTLTVLSCTKYDGLVDSEKYFGRRVYGSDLSKYKTVPYGCFAYATNHIEEGAIGLQMQYDLALISPMYTVFRIDNKKVDPLYLFYLLKSPCYVRKFKKRTEGSVNRRGGLHWHSFSQIKVKLPNVEIQKKIAKILKYSQTELDLLSKKLAVFQKQKRGLMQKLLTGTWRV